MIHLFLNEQIKHHALAIISLIIAFIALGYSAWREEKTEANLNTRMASFEILKNLGQLQVIVNFTHYGMEDNKMNAYEGWGYVALISDLGELLAPSVEKQTKELAKVWGENWKKLKEDPSATEKISEQIDLSRDTVLKEIKNIH